MTRAPGEAAAPSTGVEHYYACPDVRRRVREYSGLVPGEAPGAAFLTSFDAGLGLHATWDAARLHAPGDLERILDGGADVGRSLWDRTSLMVHVDLDYLNVDHPGEAFLRPVEVFFKLEPLYQALRALLWEFELPLLPLVTGQGYHFTGRVRLVEGVIDRLARLAPASPRRWLGHAGTPPPPAEGVLEERTVRAWFGLGLVLEHLAHRLIRSAAPSSAVPIVVNGTVVGEGPVGRECLSIDLSYLGDPLVRRSIRSAFSVYRKHLFRSDIYGDRVARWVPPLATVPREAAHLDAAFFRTRTLEGALRMAGGTQAHVPEVPRGVTRLLEEYLDAPVAEVHRRYFARWPETDHGDRDADRPDPATFPDCMAAALREPNDRLLRPEHIQHLVRGLMARGWEPSRIARLLAALYREDHGWGDRWQSRDPALRAEWDVRVFSTLLRVGLDEAVDFNCTSAQEKGICPRTDCRRDLRVDRARLLREVKG